MENLKNVKLYDISGRWIELDNYPHFVIVVGEKEQGEIICEFGVLDKTKFKRTAETYHIQSFSEMPKIEENLNERGCVFFCSFKKNDPDNTFVLFPMLVKHKLEGKANENEEIYIACELKMPQSGELQVELLQVKLSDVNEAGFRIGESFYRVGVLENRGNILRKQ